MTVGERLREQREALDLTLKQVASQEGITLQYLSKLERGINDPSVWHLLARLALRYGCSTDYLLGLTDDPAPAGRTSEIEQVYERLSEARRADVLDLASNWLREESPAYQEETLIALIENIDSADEQLRAILDEAFGRLGLDEEPGDD